MADSLATPTPDRRRPYGGDPARFEPTDRQLLELFLRAHDAAAQHAFATLVRRHGPMVLRVCRSSLLDRHRAEDAFQATFLILARNAASIRCPDSLGGWLHGVARRTAQKAQAQALQRRRHEALDALEGLPVADDEASRPDLRSLRREEYEALHEELRRLPGRYRLPIALCHLEGLSYTEAARRLGWPAGTLAVRLMRGRALLRSRLTRRGLAPLVGLFAARSATAQVPPGLLASTVRAASRASARIGRIAGPSPRLALAPGGREITLKSGWRISSLGLRAALLVGVVGVGTLTGLPERGTSSIGPTPRQVGADRLALDQQDTGVPGTTGRRPSPTVQAAPTPDGSDRSPPHPDDESTPAGSGRDADAQVTLALWCEARGLTAERLRHLARAVLIDPDHPTARGLLGLVAHRGRWRHPDAVATSVRSDADLTRGLDEYATRRRRAPRTAEGQKELARWCRRRGFDDQARAHLIAAIRLDPDDAATWRLLGYRRYQGRWLTEDQIAERRAAARAQEDADRRWRPVLARWRGWLDRPERRGEAEWALSRLDDPGAIPAIWSVFGGAAAPQQARVAQLLGQIDAPAATRGLAVLAVASPWPEVRRVACESLANREPHEAEGLLVGLLRDPELNPETVLFRYRWLPTGALGPGSPGITVVEGRHANAVRIYTVDESFGMSSVPSDYACRVAVQNARQQSELAGVVEELTTEAIRELGPIILTRRQVNARAIQALRCLTGRDLGDWEAWKRRWVEGQGYAYEPGRYRNPPDPALFAAKPTFVSSLHFSCFAAGTPVRTMTGPRPIESIEAGDLVLAQDAETGGLGYAPVLAAVENPPTRTLRVALEGRTIVATELHRFWVVGVGWTMARDLRPGDAVRALDGPVRVSGVTAGGTRPVFNLEVDGSHSFFAGDPGALVHDNSPVRAMSRPFDRAPEGTRLGL